MTVRAPMINGDTDSAETFRLALSGLWVPGAALTARTGVTQAPTLTGTGAFTATVSAFTAIVAGTSNALQGAYPVALDAAAPITIGAASPQPRVDLVCLQMQDNTYDASGFTRGIVVVVAGTPSGSPVAPAAPASSIPLFTVPIAASATSVNFASATAVYPNTAAAGGIVPVRSSGDKPAVVGAVQYRHRLDVGSGGSAPLEWSVDGTTWSTVFDQAGTLSAAYASAVAYTNSAIAAIPSGYGSWTTLTAASGWNIGSLPLQYRTAPGNRIELRGVVAPSSSMAAGAYYVTTTIPTAMNPASNRWFLVPTNTNGGGVMGSANINIYPGQGIYAVLNSTTGGGLTFDGASYTT